jgi:RecJ-like exonuclease
MGCRDHSSAHIGTLPRGETESTSIFSIPTVFQKQDATASAKMAAFDVSAFH